jgi:hypothetical protein
LPTPKPGFESRSAHFKNFTFFGSVEIPDITSIPEIRDEPVFDGYRKGGCRSGGGEAPKNVMKNDDFYRALFS